MKHQSKNSSHIPNGLYEGKIVHISELSEEHTGRRCGCYCPVCGTRMLAKSINGKYTAHFAHEHNISECSLAAETGIHLKAKEIISENLSLLLPTLVVGASVTIGELEYSDSCYVVKQKRNFLFEEARIEEWRGSYRPDLVVMKGGRELLVEIKVTHEVDDEKRAKIKKDRISSLEINLSKIDRMSTPKDIQSAVEVIDNLSWVFHSKTGEAHEELKKNMLANANFYLEEQRQERDDRNKRNREAKAAREIERKKEKAL
ncbi:hypothetical protein ELY33_00970 [Vreelandella andesensis]|uniref:Competence protein CoiA n=1 Tax=Vreelandella andesensis TaxID=447567 RepID=A0A433KYD9_9GAMM|nr:hypothetical protein [Halomonas andesensis]RUR34782.1 hypothetical protein ELY33_00970 [Halomonas andesensis]